MSAFLHTQPWWYWALVPVALAMILFGPVRAWLRRERRDRELWLSMNGAVDVRDRREPWLDFLPVELDERIARRDRDRKLWDAIAAHAVPDGLVEACKGILSAPADAARLEAGAMIGNLADPNAGRGGSR